MPNPRLKRNPDDRMERLVRQYVNLADMENIATFISACELDGTTPEEWTVCHYLESRFAEALAARKSAEAEYLAAFDHAMWLRQHPSPDETPLGNDALREMWLQAHPSERA